MDEVSNLATMFLGSQSSYEDISIVDANGKVLYSSNSNLIGTDISGESYFVNMATSGLSTQSALHISSASGEPCITFAIPLRTDMVMVGVAPNRESPAVNKRNPAMENALNPNINVGLPNTPENFIGAIIISVKVSAFDRILSNIKVADYKTGYAFILDSEGNVIYHPDESLIGTKLNVTEIDSLLAQIKRGEIPESSIIKFSYNNIKKYAGFKINEDNKWIVFVGADESEILKSLNALASNTLLTTVILVLLISALANIISGRITKYIKTITKLINKTAELDFTDDKTFEGLYLQNDEIGKMSRAIEEMRSTLKNIILHLSNVSVQILESSDNLNNIASSVNKNARDNSSTAEELSASMEETTSTTQQINASIELMKENTKDIANQIVLGTNLSEDIKSRAQNMEVITSNATQKTKKIYDEIKARTDAAIEQSKAVEKINILSRTIEEIANQTNILALNASIEAARAGEAGSGFAVVAHEIGELANQSAKTISLITKTVKEVYEVVDTMSKSLEQILGFLEENVLPDYDTFLRSSKQYNDDAGLMSQTMERIEKQVDQLNANVLSIAGSISEINMMIAEATAGINDVAEKSTNIVTLTGKTYSMASENTVLANSLKEIISKFKL